MANTNQPWDDLGKNIEDIIDRAINSQDYQKLNQTIRQTVERALDLGTEAVKKAVNNAQTTQKPPQTTPKPQLPALYGNTGSKTAVGVLQTVGGSLLSATTGLSLLAAGIIEFISPYTANFGPGAVVATAGLGVGVWLLGSGICLLTRLSRFKTYRKILGNKTHCTLEKLGRSVGKNVKQVRRDVKKLIGEGLFLEGHLDHEQTSLITSDETYKHYQQSRLALAERQRLEAAQKAQPQPKPDPAQEVLDKGNAFIAQIRACNDDIPGEEISAKIDRMELIVQRIFDRAKAHPEIVPDLKKLMDYYLPMTVKLLRAYADMDAQPVQGETILASKREIEDSLDTLNLAFEKLLDSVFKDTALDVSSDITVLNTLLAQEGLTEDEISRTRHQIKRRGE